MLFTENQLKSVLYGYAKPLEVARQYFEDNKESILEDTTHTIGAKMIVEEINKQVKEYSHFTYAKKKSIEHLKLVKESLKVSEGFRDLQNLKYCVECHSGTSVYFSLVNVFNDEVIEYVEKVIPLYGDLLGTCAYYRGDFNSFYYTYFIEEEDVTEEDVLCFTIDKVKEWLED